MSGCNIYDSSRVSDEVIQPSVTSNQTLYWIEFQGRFNTKDIGRAQKEIPFPIITPSYLPDNQQITNLPDIEGPLSGFRDEKRIEIYIRYVVDRVDNLKGLLKITEMNYESTLGDAELDPDLETTEFNNITVVKTKDNWTSGMVYYYSFHSNGIYYIVETHDIPVEESIKVVKSIVNQL